MFALIVLFVLWVAGIVYCERVADEREWNQWLARGASILLPILGPLIYWYLRRRSHLTG